MATFNSINIIKINIINIIHNISMDESIDQPVVSFCPDGTNGLVHLSTCDICPDDTYLCPSLPVDHRPSILHNISMDESIDQPVLSFCPDGTNGLVHLSTCDICPDDTYARRSRWIIGHLRPLAIALCSGLFWSFRTSWSPAVLALTQCLASN